MSRKSRLAAHIYGAEHKKGTLIFSHGMGVPSDYYIHEVRYFARAGYRSILFDNTRYADTVELYERYGIFPTPSEWQGKILLLETSEEKTPPQLYKKMLEALKQRGVFNSVAGHATPPPVVLFRSELRLGLI